MRLGLVSDTHAPRFWRSLPDRVAAAFEGVDLIVHAGDVCVPSVLDELATLAPVRAVQGNNDGRDVAAWGAPEVLELDLAGVRVAVVHDSGPAAGRLARLRRRFPAAGLVVFGHSHIPWDEGGDGRDPAAGGTGSRVVNPGSPTDRRRQPHGTVARLDLVDGRVGPVRLVEVS